MARRLIEARTPIDVGSIVIDDSQYPSFDPVGYVDYQDFKYGALEQSAGYSTFGADYAQRYAVRCLIDSTDLGILPPGDAIAGEGSWGPYDPGAYYIKAEAFAESADTIETLAGRETKFPIVLGIIKAVSLRADAILREDTDGTPYHQLPDAFVTKRLPKGRLERGELIAFEDFQRAAWDLSTSPGKVCSVFDELIGLLGDEKARQQIAQLSALGDPSARRFLRETCYVKTQSLNDFLAKLDSSPPGRQGVFNTLGRRILRNVIYEESYPPTDTAIGEST